MPLERPTNQLLLTKSPRLPKIILQRILNKRMRRKKNTSDAKTARRMLNFLDKLPPNKFRESKKRDSREKKRRLSKRQRPPLKQPKRQRRRRNVSRRNVNWLLPKRRKRKIFIVPGQR